MKLIRNEICYHCQAKQWKINHVALQFQLISFFTFLCREFDIPTSNLGNPCFVDKIIKVAPETLLSCINDVFGYRKSRGLDKRDLNLVFVCGV